MSMKSWLSFFRRSPRRPLARSSQRMRLCLETLEDRITPADAAPFPLLTVTPNTVQQLGGISVNQATLDRWAPTLYFHPSEKYFPVSADYLLANSDLRKRDSNADSPPNDEKTSQIVKFSPLTQADLTEAITSDPLYFLDIHSQAFQGNDGRGKPSDSNPLIAPLYVYAAPAADGSYVDLTYISLFAKNGLQSAGIEKGTFFRGLFHSLAPLISVGPIELESRFEIYPFADHEGDADAMVTVRLTPNLDRVIFVRLEGHGDGSFYLPQEMRWEGTTHVKVAVALNSHASMNPADPQWKTAASEADGGQSYLTPINLAENKVELIHALTGTAFFYNYAVKGGLADFFSTAGYHWNPGFNGSEILLLGAMDPSTSRSIASPNQAWGKFVGRIGAAEAVDLAQTEARALTGGIVGVDGIPVLGTVPISMAYLDRVSSRVKALTAAGQNFLAGFAGYGGFDPKLKDLVLGKIKKVIPDNLLHKDGPGLRTDQFDTQGEKRYVHTGKFQVIATNGLALTAPDLPPETVYRPLRLDAYSDAGLPFQTWTWQKLTRGAEEAKYTVYALYNERTQTYLGVDPRGGGTQFFAIHASLFGIDAATLGTDPAQLPFGGAELLGLWMTWMPSVPEAMTDLTIATAFNNRNPSGAPVTLNVAGQTQWKLLPIRSPQLDTASSESAPFNDLRRTTVVLDRPYANVVAGNPVTITGGVVPTGFVGYDFGFELPRLGHEPNRLLNAPSPSLWTFKNVHAGIVGNGNPFGYPAAPEGTQAAFFFGNSGVSQSINFPADGNYTIRFRAATGVGTGPSQGIFVGIGDTTQLLSPPGTSYSELTTRPFFVQKGAREIRFSGVGNGLVFIDQVEIIAAVGDSPRGESWLHPTGSVSITDGVNTISDIPVIPSGAWGAFSITIPENHPLSSSIGQKKLVVTYHGDGRDFGSAAASVLSVTAIRPLFDRPANITAEAKGVAGAEVNYTLPTTTTGLEPVIPFNFGRGIAGIAVAPNLDVYVASGNGVYVYGKNGTLLRSYTSPDFDLLFTDITIVGSEVFVAFQSSVSGTGVRIFGLNLGAYSEFFTTVISGIAGGPNNDLYYSSGNRLFHVTTRGALLHFSRTASEPNLVYSDVTVVGSTVWAASKSSVYGNRLQGFDLDLNPLSAFQMDFPIDRIAAGVNDDLYLSSGNNLYHYSTDGTQLHSFQNTTDANAVWSAFAAQGSSVYSAYISSFVPVHVKAFDLTLTPTPADSFQTRLEPGSVFPIGTTSVVLRSTNQAGVSFTHSFEVTVEDTTPPTAGTVNDGPAADIDFQALTDTIVASWTGFSDSGSGIAFYRWAIGTTPGGFDVQPFTSVGLDTSARNSSLTLTAGATYYVTVLATDGVGNQSDATSNGVTISQIRLTANLLTQTQKVGRKVVKTDVIKVTASPTGKVTTIVSPLQKKAYPTLNLTVTDTNGDGSDDTITVTGKKKVGRKTTSAGPITAFTLGLGADTLSNAPGIVVHGTPGNDTIALEWYTTNDHTPDEVLHAPFPAHRDFLRVRMNGIVTLEVEYTPRDNGTKPTVIVYGEEGDDTIIMTDGGAGQHWDADFHGGPGNDTLIASNQLFSRRRASYLYGEAGKDTLIAGAGKALLVGGGGDDTIRGGSGANWVFDRPGRDKFTPGTGATISIPGTTSLDIAKTAFDKGLTALVASFHPWDKNPNGLPVLRFAVRFTAPVAGLGIHDFNLTTTGFLPEAALLSVTRLGSTVYLVRVRPGPGAGFLRVDLLDNDTSFNTEEHEGIVPPPATIAGSAFAFLLPG